MNSKTLHKFSSLTAPFTFGSKVFVALCIRIENLSERNLKHGTAIAKIS